MQQVLCIGGPTGVGKDTVVSYFQELKSAYIWVPRVTTRLPREGEVHGIHYFFSTEEAFSKLEQKKQIVAVDQFCGNRYGIDLSILEECMSHGRNVVGIFGACSLYLREKLNGQSMLVYVTASLHNIRERLYCRSASSNEAEQRFREVERQIANESMKFDYMVNNDGPVEDTARQLAKLVELH